MLGLFASSMLCVLILDSYMQQKKIYELQLKNSTLLQEYNILKEKWNVFVNSGSYPYELANNLENLKKQLLQTNLELVRAKEALTKAKQECASLESSNAFLNADKKSLSEKISSIELKLFTKQLELIESKEQETFLRKQNDDLKLQSQYKLTQPHDELVRQNERYKQQTASQQTEISSLKNEIISLSRKLLDSDNKLTNATSKLNRHTAQYHELQIKHAHLESNYYLLADQHRSAQLSLNSTPSAPPFEIELPKARNDVDELHRILEQSRREQQTSTIEIQRMNSELIKLQKEKQEKEIELKESYKDLEGLHITYAQDKKRLEDMIAALKSKLQKIRDGELEVPTKKAKL